MPFTHASARRLAGAICALGLFAATASATPPGAPQVTVGADIKQLQFDWQILPRSNYYEFWYKSDNHRRVALWAVARTAAEFSFFVAIPVLLSATAYELWKERAAISQFDAAPLVLSCIVSLVGALLAVKFLIRFVSRRW